MFAVSDYEKLERNRFELYFGVDYRRELINPTVQSAFEIAVDLPVLYNYIFENFPNLYNKSSGNYGNIAAVKKMNAGRKSYSIWL